MININNDLTPVLLWTNNSISSGMTTKTISINTSSYKRIRIEYVLRVESLTDLKTEEVIIDGNNEVSSALTRSIIVSTNNKFRLYSRSYTITSSKIYFSYGVQVSETSVYSENISNIMIPKRIYGLYK